MNKEMLIESLQNKIATVKSHELLEELDHTIDGMLDVDAGKDFWDELTETQKRNIEISLQQAQYGQMIRHEEVMELVNSWVKINKNQIQ
jgi:hypothetical protein